MSTINIRPTTVISVRGRERAELLADPDFAYVGRRCAGWPASPFGNPFKADRGSLMFVGKAPRWDASTKEIASIQCVGHFEACLKTGGGEPWETMRRLLPTLRGKRLGCWCGNYDGTGEPHFYCHAIVLARLADRMDAVPNTGGITPDE